MIWGLLSVLLPTVSGSLPRPRLVVVITVDQLRPDYLARYRRQLVSGLDLLESEGAVFVRAYQDHAVTETAPGHASVLSGRWPVHTGIVRNGAGVQDSTAPLLGAPGPGASPARFQGTTLFDWLEAAEPGARALSVSRKDRSAILTIGRAKQQVYWYQSGQFTTSRYYADSLPGWVREWNDQHKPSEAADVTWAPLLPDAEYPEPDSEPYEHGGRDVAFPHQLPLVATPAMDSLTLAFALAGVRALELGGRGTTDLLAVGLSATDAIGHAFGPESREIHDQVLRLDRYLGWFLGQLLVRYGGEGLLVVLTADHGVTPFPEWSRAHGHPHAGWVSVDTMVRAVNAALGDRVGPGQGLAFDMGMLSWPARAAFAAGGGNADSVIADLAARLRTTPGVARVARPADLARADTVTDPVARRWLHAIPVDGDVILVATLTPFWVWGETHAATAEHGQPSELDAHVPLILWGRGVRPGTYAERASSVDIAPTLARLLDLVPAQPLDGRALTQALDLKP
jgi:arylsulfatase A-like enzyme